MTMVTPALGVASAARTESCSCITLNVIQVFEEPTMVLSVQRVATMPTKLEATHLRDNRWAVRPEGQLGTCGWHPKPWTVIYVKARSADEAIKKAEKVLES